ncbi:MaoC family dehydratase [Nesterenkonia sp. HG001]|uniref:MaoC family dehydratase n=1 Tax=Nesterenkonia sp. HG001 TaxID=2983207 RepID=UPI002AC59971|nr:MaoC/PaaZ C-terminal domain-containing protein [Nesterenkonia sp. HG001]MDZ5077968.1 MaoC/PaaZ C-terminal domain-containing protein [Nesterenkonia sp. HG001]
MSPEEIRRIELQALPQVYLRAGWEAARSAVGGRSGAGEQSLLPADAVVARHPGTTSAQVEDYRRLVGGEVFDGRHRSGLPSVLVHIMGFPVQMGLLGREDFPLPLMGMVHLSNVVEHRRPVTAETPVQIRAWAEGLRPHRRGTVFDAVVEVLSEDAEVEEPTESDVLWRGTSTYLSRGVHLAGRPDASQTESRSGREEFTPPLKTAQWRLGADAGRRYAAVSGDWNPIHVSGISARALGMPRAIVHGMYAAGRMLEGREPEQAGHRWRISFEAPMRLPGTVAFHAGRDEAAEGAVWSFTGWDARKGRRHFHGELVLPA